MADGNAKYRVGDRIQKIDQRSADDRVFPGERGFVTAAPGLGGITAYWDSGTELAVTDERQIRPVPPEEELKLFSGMSCLQLGDSQAEWDARCEENTRLVSAMEGFAERKGCMWAVKRTFLDDAHKSRSPRFELVDGDGLSALVEGCDAKNGMDVGFSAKRIAAARSMMMVAYGQGYRSPKYGDGIVKELIECRLVRRAISVLYQEKIDEGMSTRGGHLAHAFFAVHQHETLAPCIHDCRAVARGTRKSPDLER